MINAEVTIMPAKRNIGVKTPIWSSEKISNCSCVGIPPNQ
jgi:hypothetical protein